MNMGTDPSVNLISILDFGPRFLSCEHLNYTSQEEEPVSAEPESKVLRIPLEKFSKTLNLYGIKEEPNPENLKIFIALLTQQERRLRDLAQMRSLKGYSKALFEASPDGIIVVDANGYIVNNNRAAVAMTRRPANTLMGSRVSYLTDRKGRAAAFQAIRNLQKQTTSRYECRLEVGAGRSIPVSICIKDCIFNEQRLIIASIRDLSYLEEEVKKATTYEESLALSIKNATDGFVRYDQFGKICEVNPYIEKLTGVFSNRLINRPVDDLLSNKSLRNFRHAVSQINKTGYASFTCLLLNASGAEIPCHAILMQFELEGERFCRLILQERRKTPHPEELPAAQSSTALAG